LIGAIGIHPQRKPDVGVQVDIEARGQHSNHDVGFAAEQNGFARQTAICTEAAAPESIADHHHFWTVGYVILSRKRSADLHLRVE
jgi:hypothetical protein